MSKFEHLAVTGVTFNTFLFFTTTPFYNIPHCKCFPILTFVYVPFRLGKIQLYSLDYVIKDIAIIGLTVMKSIPESLLIEFKIVYFYAKKTEFKIIYNITFLENVPFFAWTKLILDLWCINYIGHNTFL